MSRKQKLTQTTFSGQTNLLTGEEKEIFVVPKREYLFSGTMEKNFSPPIHHLKDSIRWVDRELTDQINQSN